jgi:hypothetical protein
MATLKTNIETAVLKEHKSVWAFCSALEECTKYHEDARSAGMLAQGLRDWASYRQSARKEYESIIKQSQNAISDIDNNQSIWFQLDSDRIKEYNAKADTQVEIVRTASYIIGLSNETLGQLFTIVSNLQFSK